MKSGAFWLLRSLLGGWSAVIKMEAAETHTPPRDTEGVPVSISTCGQPFTAWEYTHGKSPLHRGLPVFCLYTLDWRINVWIRLGFHLNGGTPITVVMFP